MMKLAKALAVAISAISLCVSAQNTEIVKVKGRGVGADKTEALKDAYRDAVERAVGMYVDAEQMMKNEELVKDQILTQSNAYIEKYDIVKENTKPNGLVEVQILAEVRTTALTKKISDVMPSKTFRLGGDLQNVHAKMSTSERRNADGAALLKKALEGFNPLMLVADCSLASPKAVIRDGNMGRRATGRRGQQPSRGSKNTLSVNYLFRFGINQQRYFEYVVPRLKDVLAQISLAEPKEVAIPVHTGNSIDEKKIVEEARCDREYCSISRPQISLNVPQSADTAEFFVLVIGANKFNTVYKGIIYELDEASSKIASDWRNKISGFIRQKDNKYLYEKSGFFNVSMIDVSGEVVFSQKMSPNRRTGSKVFNCVSWRSHYINRGLITATIVAPWDRNYHDWQKFDIPEDVLPTIKDLKIEIAQ